MMRGSGDWNSFVQLSKSDVHPVFVNWVLMHYTSWFGNNTATIRLPFVILGLVTVLFAYLLGTRWFNSTVGLLTAICWAFLPLLVVFTEMARPYNPATTFTLLTAWFWTTIIQKKEQPTAWYNYLGFVVFAALCTYTHYFSFLQALLLGLAGLFFVRGKNLLYYILSGVLVLLLYLPHLPVLLAHLQLDGLDWLGKPNGNWLWQFGWELTLGHTWLLFIIVAIMVYYYWINRRKIYWSKYHLLSLLLFILPLTIAYIKSVVGKPVLQPSVMLPALSFLLMFVFSPAMGRNTGFKAMLPVWVWLLAAAYLPLSNPSVLSPEAWGNFEKISSQIDQWDKQYSNRGITHITNVYDPYYANYYYQGVDDAPQFALTRLDEDAHIMALKQVLKTAATPYFSTSYIHKYSPAWVEPMIRQYFPVVVDHQVGKNDGAKLFARFPLPGDTIFHQMITFDDSTDAGLKLLQSEVVFSGTRAQQLGTDGYSTELLVDKAAQNKFGTDDIILVHAKLYAEQVTTLWGNLVLQDAGSGKNWYGMQHSQYMRQAHTWTDVYLHVNANLLTDTTGFKVFVYNSNQGNLYLDDLEVLVIRPR